MKKMCEIGGTGITGIVVSSTDYNPFGGAFKIGDKVISSNGDIGEVVRLTPAEDGHTVEEMFENPWMEAGAVVRVSAYGEGTGCCGDHFDDAGIPLSGFNHEWSFIENDLMPYVVN